MGNNAVGTLRKVTLDGVTYNAAADADISHIRGAYANEGVAASGSAMRKITRRLQTIDGVDLLTNALEFDALSKLSENLKDIPMSVTMASGDIYRATGFIDLEKRQSMEGKTTIKMIPRDGWELFAAR